jgi:hypothetical protein
VYSGRSGFMALHPRRQYSAYKNCIMFWSFGYNYTVITLLTACVKEIVIVSDGILCCIFRFRWIPRNRSPAHFRRQPRTWRTYHLFLHPWALKWFPRWVQQWKITDERYVVPEVKCVALSVG